jgi:hypothetical protein
MSVVEDIPGLNSSLSENSRPDSQRVHSSRLLSVQLSSSSPQASPRTPSAAQPSTKPDASKLPSDFYFGVCLGEGAFARVVHAKLKKNNKEYAVKIMEKRHIKKENKVAHRLSLTLSVSFSSSSSVKVKYVMMEKTILSKLNHPFIVRFVFTLPLRSSPLSPSLDLDLSLSDCITPSRTVGISTCVWISLTAVN